jgi:hypothetical protein
MTLTDRIEELTSESRWDFSDLNALYINCTLKKSPEPSHSQGLIDISTSIMEKNGVEVEMIRAIDYDLASGVWPDMTEHGWDRDDWPVIFERVEAADILVLGSAIWLGEKTSVHPGHRALLRQLIASEPIRPVRLLRAGRGLSHHRQ